MSGGGGGGAVTTGKGGVAAEDAGMSRCHGFLLSTSWPFSFLGATLGAGYQQVTAFGAKFLFYFIFSALIPSCLVPTKARCNVFFQVRVKRRTVDGSFLASC